MPRGRVALCQRDGAAHARHGGVSRRRRAKSAQALGVPVPAPGGRHNIRIWYRRSMTPLRGAEMPIDGSGWLRPRGFTGEVDTE